jgi:hypothetical protein
MRITLLLIVCFAVAALSQPAEAQQAKKVPRIGFLRLGPPSEDIIEALRQGLSEFGYILTGRILPSNTVGQRAHRTI